MKKSFSMIGMICGIVVILLGILVLAGAMGGDVVSAGGAPSYYDSGYATFGADFYTYVSNNAAEAASAGRAAATNAREIGSLLKHALGTLIMAFGLFMTCSFGIKYAESLDELKKAAQILTPDDQPEDLPEI